jgi:hypothetical protein
LYGFLAEKQVFPPFGDPDIRYSMLDTRCWITAVQNKSTGDLADLKTQGLRVGFRLFRGEVPQYELMISRVQATAAAISGQRQKTAAENSDSGRGQ